jgi:sortase B
MKKFIGILLLIISMVMFGFCIYMLYDKFNGYKENEEIYAEIANVAIKPIENNDNNDDESSNTIEEIQEKIENEDDFTEFTIDWESLKDYNVVGWVKFGTQINYPIMKASDNKYYLTHAYNDVYNANGSIFMNSKNDSYFRDENTIVYGHNLRSGKMFGSIKYYKEEGYGTTSFCVYMPDGTKHTYDILSIAEVKDGSEAYQYSFSTIEKYEEYQKTMKKQSLYDTGISIDTTKKIVTLSTSSSRGSSAGWRVVVVGLESSVEQIQEAASWYEEPTDSHPSVIGNQKEIQEQNEKMMEEKRKKKEEEIQNSLNGN